MLSEAIDWLLVLVSVVPAWIVVGILFLDHFPLLLVEQLELWVEIGEPRMVQNLFIAQSLVLVDLQEPSEHVPGLLGHIIFKRVDTPQDQAVQLLHACGLERHCAVQHCVENHTGASQIHVACVATLTSEDLWSNISRSTTLLTHLGARRDLLGHTKVRNFDLAFSIKQYVV